MTPSATFPTPYGVSVPCFDHPSVDGEYVFSPDAAAICAGIHDPKKRARFVADVTSAGRCDMSRMHEYGGGPVPRVSIARPTSAAYPLIPQGDDFAIPIDNWVTALMDCSRWCDRANTLMEIIESNLAQSDRLAYGKGFEPILALSLQIMLTGALEHLAEREIDCLEAAAFYALSTHPEWSKPAVGWLKPMADTWFRDWVVARPIYQRFAALVREDSDLPAWIVGGAR